MSTQTNFPGTAANDASVGSGAWSNVNNAKATDSVYATWTNASGTTESNYLKLTNYGFSTSGTINGMATAAIRHADQDTGKAFIADDVFYLIKGGTIQTGHSEISGTNWTTTDTTENEGSGSDLWTISWTSTDINGSGFGCALAVVNQAGSEIASVDSISITVTYTPSGGVPGAPSNLVVTAQTSTSISLSWTQGSGTVTDDIVRSSTDASTWTDHDLGSAVTTATISGLTANTVYYFQVRAHNGSGDSGESNMAVGYTNPAVLSGTLTLKPVSDNTVNTWTITGGLGTFAATLTDGSDSTYATPPATNSINLVTNLAATPTVTFVAISAITFSARMKTSNAGDTQGVIMSAQRSNATNLTSVGVQVSASITTSFANYTTSAATLSGTQAFADWSSAQLTLTTPDANGDCLVSESSITITYIALEPSGGSAVVSGGAQTSGLAGALGAQTFMVGSSGRAATW